MFTMLAEVSFRRGFICVADIRVVASRIYYANAKRRKRLRKKPCRKENSAGRVRDVLFDWSNRRTTTTSPGDGRKGAWERGSNISSTTIFTIVPFYVGTYNKKFGIQLGNEVWRNSCVERVLLCITIVTCLYLTRGRVGALFHFWPFCALDIRW